MAIHGAITKPYLYFGGYKISPVLNSMTLKYGHEVKDGTTFGQDTKINMAGLTQIALDGEGFLDLTQYAQDEQVYANVSLNNVAVTLMPQNTPVVGGPAYFFKAATTSYDPGGSIGDIAKCSFNMMGGDGGYPMCRGFILEPGTTAKTATGNGTALNLGAVAEGEYVYAVLHVTSVSAGDDITVIIASDTEEAFGDTPETQISFTLAAAIGGQFAVRVAGPITDTWWRCEHTINGADPSILFACSMAIL